MANPPATAAQRMTDMGSGIDAVFAPGALVVLVEPAVDPVVEVAVDVVVEPVVEERSSWAIWMLGSVAFKSGVPRALSTLRLKSRWPPFAADFSPSENNRPS